MSSELIDLLLPPQQLSRCNCSVIYIWALQFLVLQQIEKFLDDDRPTTSTSIASNA